MYNGLKLRTRNNPRYSWMDCGVPTSIRCQLPPVELRSEPFRMPGMWQRVPPGEREGLQRLAGAKHGAKSSLARTLLSLTVFYFCSTAWIWALDPGRRISQYSHTAWRVRDGAFAGAPSTITQTTDGYVWIGTNAGLVGFEVVRFVSFAPPAGQHLPSPAVISLLGATDGSLTSGQGWQAVISIVHQGMIKPVILLHWVVRCVLVALLWNAPLGMARDGD